MQLSAPRGAAGPAAAGAPVREKSIRGTLKAAACMLLASGVPGMTRAADSGPTTQLDITTLLYGEASRVSVFEPIARITRQYPGGQSFYYQFGVDAITGASPSGGLPSGQTQTVTSPSGNVSTRSASDIPTSTFKDTRWSLDGGWMKPFGSFTPTLGAHFSTEKDYQSVGVNGKASIDFWHHLTTLSMGAGYNRDEIFPVGGTTGGLTDPGVIVGTGNNPKRVTTAMIGLSQVFTRRWMMAVNLSRTGEQGYLTEPYKVLSLMDPTSGLTVGELTENRPTTRQRTSVLLNSVYHPDAGVFYASYRHYWDDWDVRSDTFDFRFRHDFGNDTFLEPHLRYYTQSSSSFFRSGLIQGEPLPEFATSDYRLGSLTTTTVGATYGFQPAGSAGEWTVRFEYLLQQGNHHPSDVVGVQEQYDLYPNMNIGSIVVGYHLDF